MLRCLPLLILFVAAGPARATEGVVVLVGSAPAIPGLATDANTTSAALGAEPPAAAADVNAAPALAELTAAADLYWNTGRAKAAIAKLRGARGKLGDAIEPKDRKAAVEGLWLLAQMLLAGKARDPAEAHAVLDHTIRIDPEASPGLESFTPTLCDAHRQRRAAYTATARRLTVKLVGDTTAGDCRALVDGVDRGALNRALGPLPRGVHSVRVSCANRMSWTHQISLASADAEIEIPAYELGLQLDAGALRLESAVHSAALETRLLTGTTIAWVLTVKPAPEGRVSCRLARGDARATVANALLPAEVAAWLQRPQAASDSPPPLPPVTRRPAWWHWALIGAGAGMVVGGGIVHHQGLAAVDDIEHSAPNAPDLVPQLPRFEAGYISLYAVGGATIAAGAVLAAIGVLDESPAAVVLPGAGSIWVRGRF